MIIIIPGWLIALLTFPGVVMHEIAHKFMCDILQIPVYEVNYFSLSKSRAGHVSHHDTNRVKYNFLIGLAPLFINSFFCMLFTLPFFSVSRIANESLILFANFFLFWVGISMGMHACPSNQDVQNILDTMQKNKNYRFIKIICYFIKAINWIRCAPLDFLYALIISLILPCLIFNI